MMPKVVKAEVDIERSAADVFAFCSDHRHEPEWNPMMKRIEKVTDGPIGIGTRYSTQFGKGPTMVMECVQYEPPTQWSLVGQSSALTVTGDNRIVPTAQGSHLVMRMEIEAHGAMKVVAPLLRRRLCTMFERDMRNIKGILEEPSRNADKSPQQWADTTPESAWRPSGQ